MKATTTLPTEAEIVRRLQTVDNDPVLTQQFYPKIGKISGDEINGVGITMRMHLAINDFIESTRQPIYEPLLQRNVPLYINVVVDDEVVKKDALQFHDEYMDALKG